MVAEREIRWYWSSEMEKEVMIEAFMMDGVILVISGCSALKTPLYKNEIVHHECT